MVIVSVFFGAVLTIGSAGGVVGISRRRLLGPENAAGREIERHDRVAGRSGRGGIIIAGGDVHYSALGIDGGSGPDASAGRSELRRSSLGFPGFLGDIRNSVSLPDGFSVTEAQGDDAAPEGAALIVGINGTSLFPGSDRDEYRAVMCNGR